MYVKVIILILTYNLKEYITEALDSVLMQKTGFDYKILIGDDGSTDGTLDILKKYKEKYPEIIDIYAAKHNGGNLLNTLRLLQRAECEYFSVLDGDDFWVGEERLQHQVDFLDRNSNYMLCSGQTQYIVDGKLKNMILPEKYLGSSYTFADYFKKPMLFHTSGLLLRNVIFREGIPQYWYEAVDTFEDCALRGEDFRRMIHLEKGPLYVLPEMVSCYRIHDKGIWSGMPETQKMIESAIATHYVKKYYQGKYPELQADIVQRANEWYSRMWKVLITNKYLFPQYRLSPKETRLLTDFLNVLSRENSVSERMQVNIF